MRELYFDGAADAPVSKEAYEAMKPFLTRGFVGNAHSIHSFGIRASQALENARRSILSDCGFSPSEDCCVFTSGATESNNWVISSLIRETENPVILTCATEHHSVLEAISNTSEAEHKKTVVLTLGVSPKTGAVASLQAAECIRKAKKLGINHINLFVISVVNNETGAYNWPEWIKWLFEENGISIAHTFLDCTQAIECGGDDMNLGAIFESADYFSFAGHKIGAPEGIGVLISRGSPSRLPKPMIVGGSQEYGHRAGTSNVCGAVGLSAAVHALKKNEELTFKYDTLHCALSMSLRELDQKLKINGRGASNILNVTFSREFLKRLFNVGESDLDKMSGDDLAQALNIRFGVACSAGAACSANSDGTPSDKASPSHVLKAMGLSDEKISRSVRFSFTEQTKRADIVELIRRFKKAIRENDVASKKGTLSK
jgi:cysteine desulfurase